MTVGLVAVFDEELKSRLGWLERYVESGVGSSRTGRVRACVCREDKKAKEEEEGRGERLEDVPFFCRCGFFDSSFSQHLGYCKAKTKVSREKSGKQGGL